MNVATLLAALQLVAGLYGQLQPLLQAVLDAHASDDPAALDAALARLQAANDALMAPATAAPLAGAAT